MTPKRFINIYGSAYTVTMGKKESAYAEQVPVHKNLLFEQGARKLDMPLITSFWQ